MKRMLTCLLDNEFVPHSDMLALLEDDGFLSTRPAGAVEADALDRGEGPSTKRTSSPPPRFAYLDHYSSDMDEGD